MSSPCQPYALIYRVAITLLEVSRLLLDTSDGYRGPAEERLLVQRGKSLHNYACATSTRRQSCTSTAARLILVFIQHYKYSKPNSLPLRPLQEPIDLNGLLAAEFYTHPLLSCHSLPLSLDRTEQDTDRHIRQHFRHHIMCFVIIFVAGCGHSAMFQISCSHPEPEHCDPLDAELIARYRSTPPCLACHTRDWDRRYALRRVEIEGLVNRLTTAEEQGVISRENRAAQMIQRAVRDHRVERRLVRQRLEQRSELIFMREWVSEHASALLGARYDLWRRADYEARLRSLHGMRLWEVLVEEWPRNRRPKGGRNVVTDAESDPPVDERLTEEVRPVLAS